MERNNFKIKAEDIRPLASNIGYCYATNKITIEGCKVGYMYRENPDDDYDSGWRFFSGTETQEYVDNPDNIKVYDINTIANYDNAIIPYLSAKVGREFKRGMNNDFHLIL